MTNDEIIAIVQHRKNGGEVEWKPVGTTIAWRLKDPAMPWDFVHSEYRPKPVDQVLYYNLSLLHLLGRPDSEHGDVAITFDAESGEPKKIEVVK